VSNPSVSAADGARPREPKDTRMTPAELALLDSIQRKVLWLAVHMVHHANQGRPNPDGTKVGGHQASSSSVVTLMTALYFTALRPGDVVAVKAHASPVFYAIEYLRGRLTLDQLKTLRQFGGLQAYPSRRKNPEVVDLATGSMGLGAVMTAFGALSARYVRDHFGVKRPERFIAMVGDAELDEGNVWEALGEEAVREPGDVLWIVDLNRQSLDRITPDSRRGQLKAWFSAAGWRVIELRWGSKIGALFGRPGGERLHARLEAMRNAEYHALLRAPAGSVRTALVKTAGGKTDRALDGLLAGVADDALHQLMADVGGHDLAAILEAFAEAGESRERPCVIIADTIKGWGLPFAGDPLNHGALLTEAQLEELRGTLGIARGEEWAGFPPDSPEAGVIARSPRPRAETAPVTGLPEIPDALGESYPSPSSTQEAFGRVLGRLARLPIGERIVTVSADVAVTTHLAAWINRKGIYFTRARSDPFEGTPQAVRWKESPEGQHIELGIAEHNLFLALGALGQSHELSGVTLLPIGTLYDPFVTRGLDALYHALYAGGKFIVAATPSGVSLSPEGGAHQSVITPGIGVALPGIVYFDPAFAQEVEWILMDGLRALASRGESLYLRLSTKPVDQSLAPPATPEQRTRVLEGGYRLIDGRSEPGWNPEDNAVHIFAAGAMVPEAVEASRALRAWGVLASVFVVTSPDRLYRGLGRPRPYLETLVSADEEGVPVVSVLDGHSHTLAFIGSALGVPQIPLGVDDFGQSGSRPALYQHYGIDAKSIMDAVRTLLARDSRLG
jgi:pyruvate dehydrogenase E1 component